MPLRAARTIGDLSTDHVLDECELQRQVAQRKVFIKDVAVRRLLGDELIDDVLEASTVLIGLPLYNFGPPSGFKAWIDRIVTPKTMGKLGDNQSLSMLSSGSPVSRRR